MIRADGHEENKGKRTSQKHPNSFPSSGKGRVAVFPRPNLYKRLQLFSKSHDCDRLPMTANRRSDVNKDLPSCLGEISLGIRDWILDSLCLRGNGHAPDDLCLKPSEA